ncbi:hypothetical protein SS1G_02128 [Sclerotinia sclerotiorum 1980 UF-70]|uniref:chitinase n=1 Tax=Sclerotinia sclerotiorum (strain ATCC 18683 / 1980 / Ss-1) TaxID=665079 RepID=A7E9Z8_SCLS1|nr:hypothetical protein SS1G_02128 [Sclerotinia sclerotiorum 1980 UF-70]EDN99276.1 hypothetical protein SS1G_02128 [Sclerotinia sclerotiorum 1980 UF-70]
MSSVAGAAALSHKEKREQKRAKVRLEKRNKPILLSPGCGGIHWNEPVEKHTITEGILVIVQFKLLHGLTVHDTSSPAGKLWLATLEYISTIHGCAIRYWGTETTQGQESIFLLVQSENAKQWVSEKVLKNWRKWEIRWRHEGIEVFGNWLEDDAAQYMAELADLIPAAVKGQHKVFLVLAWNRDEESEIVQNDATVLEAEFKEEMMTDGVKEFMMNEFLIPKSIQINIKTEKNDSFPDAKPQYTADSLASLLRLSPPRRHSETPVGNSPYFSFCTDTTHIESIYDAAVGKRQFPGPRGFFMKMGTFHKNEYINPESNRSIRLQRPPKMDFLWLKFEPGRLDTGKSISESLVELRKSIKEDVGYRASLYWGRSLDDSDEWVLMIEWYKKKDRLQENLESVDIASTSQTVQNHLRDFEFYNSYEEGIMGMECSWVSLLRDDPPDPASVPVKQAGINLHYFFHNYPSSSPVLNNEVAEAQTPNRSYFTAITMWRSKDAMREWYTDSASQCEDYERLGHRLDQLRIFCENLEVVDSKVFDMVGDCYEISKPPMPKYFVSDQGRSTEIISGYPTPISDLPRGDNFLEIESFALNRCPASCSEAGNNPANWTAYHDTRRLAVCNETMLLDFTIYNSLNDSNTQTTIYACKTNSTQSERSSLSRRDTACPLSNNSKNAKVSLELGWSGASSQNNTSDVVSAAEQLKTYVTLKEDNCGETSAFAYAGTVAIGIYVGSRIQDASSILEDFIVEVTKNGVFDTIFVQHCAGNGLNSNYAFGIVARMDGSLADVQGTVKTWRDSGCITSSTLCSTLAVGQHVCCSDGNLPDYSPQPNANGTCATYTVVTNDSCSQLAALNSITVDDIESFNRQTWGWMGCADLQAGYNICLSTGNPPMPATVANAICGPQVPGTIQSTSGLNFSLYNQCNMNACCDVWGQCGTTAEFCTETQSPTRAPGTAAAGTNGCISNCGTEIVVGNPPAEFKKVGYWEGYNFDRPCLNKPITSINTTAGYTHVHLAFATITTDFEVDVSSIQEAFSDFLSMSGLGFKRILSFGGWDFSTDVATYQIFRDAMAPANSKKFAANVAAFVKKYDLDGVDFDWEYPGEPDIPGIPAGSLDDGVNYVRFFDELAAVLPAGTTQSVTAPTSYWYLAPFLILELSLIVDYVIYMTYDLHGQWDYGSAFSDASCPAGNCLRSGANLTETLESLSMITKAGVASNKVIVGVTSYGRSFQMATPGCYLDSCTYTGPTSGAYAGACTQTPANAEIDSIISGNATVLGTDGSSVRVTGTPFVYLDDSYSNIVVYNDDQWISYMNDANKIVRTALYKHYNFGGTADWAVDLQSYDGDNGSGSDGSSIVYVDQSIWTDGPSSTGVGGSDGTIGTSGASDNLSLTCEPPCIIVLPPFPLGTTTIFQVASPNQQRPRPDMEVVNVESSDANHPADCLAVMVDVESLGVVVAAVHLDVRGTAPLVYVEVLAVLEEHVDLLDPTTIIIMITECEETVACTAEDTRTTTTATTGYPVTTASMTGFYDSDPTSINTNYDAIASSIIQAGLKYYGFLKSTATMATASPTATVVTITSNIVATPTPEAIVPQAVCLLVADVLWYSVQIITNGFETDLGAAIKKQEGGCGDLLSWEASDVSIPEGFATWTGTREYSFTLPLTIKAGCVERAIASAGGPSGLSCDNVL